MAEQPLLKGVIDINESISTSDFVLSLAEAVTPEGAAHALKDYVVTERLLENFEEALGLIKSALAWRAGTPGGPFPSCRSSPVSATYASWSARRCRARRRRRFRTR